MKTNVLIMCGVLSLGVTPARSLCQDAWKVAVERIDEADGAAEKEVERSIEAIAKLFEDAKKNAKPFATDLYSLKGKWGVVKTSVRKGNNDYGFAGVIVGAQKAGPLGAALGTVASAVVENATKDSEKDYSKFILERFETHLFKGEDVKKALEAAVKQHMAALDRMDNELLVKLRADIDDSEPLASITIPSLRSEKVFLAAYVRAKTGVTPLLKRNLREAVALEMLSFVASDLASRVAVRVGAAIATRIGVSSGILASGAATGAASLGVSIVASLVVDAAIDEIMKEAGYDPEKRVADRIEKILDDVRDSLVDGHEEAKGLHALALKLSGPASDPLVRAEALKAVKAIEKSGALGIKHELTEYTKARNVQRRAALEKILKQEMK